MTELEKDCEEREETKTEILGEPVIAAGGVMHVSQPPAFTMNPETGMLEMRVGGNEPIVIDQDMAERLGLQNIVDDQKKPEPVDCPVCGNRVTTKQFCPECGTRLFCPGCGKRVNKTNYCPECGTRLL